MESIAFEYLLWAKLLRKRGVSLTKMVGSGGGTYSRLFNQIKADILNLEYVIPERNEGAILGNAMLAAYAVGEVKDLREAAKNWVKFKESFKPREKISAFYGEVAKMREEILNGPLRNCFKGLVKLNKIEVPGN